jgi:mycothiol synthase
MNIPIENIPSIDGLSFRLFRGAADLPNILAIAEDCVDRDKIERVPTLEQLTEQFDRLENCHPLEDMMFAEINGRAIGFVRGYWWQDLDLGLQYGHIGLLIPQWRCHGISSVMLNWIEGHLRQIGMTHAPELPKHFQTRCFEFQTDRIELLEQAGYQPIRYFVQMVRPNLDNIPNCELPDGISIRPALPEHYRAIWDVLVETFRDAWGVPSFTEESYQAWLANQEYFQPHLWQIAWDDLQNTIVGHVLTFIHDAENAQNQRQRGYTESIGVVRSWRRRGVASALIIRSLQAQKAAGMTESALGVDTANPSGANRLYERCGFQTVRRNIIFSKPLGKLQRFANL